MIVTISASILTTAAIVPFYLLSPFIFDMAQCGVLVGCQSASGSKQTLHVLLPSMHSMASAADFCLYGWWLFTTLIKQYNLAEKKHSETQFLLSSSIVELA